MKRNVLNSPRLSELKKHRRKIFIRKILIFAFGILAILAILVYISRIKSVNIGDVEVVGNKIVDTQDIKDTVNTSLAGKYLWVFPKTNILFYPKNNIEKVLQTKFERLKDINISIQNDKTLLITVDERDPMYTWCGADLPQTGTDEKCYFLDDQGYVFDDAPYFSGQVYFKFYGADGIDTDNPLGSYFSKDNFSKLVSFRDYLVGMGLKPVALNITTAGDVEVYLTSATTGAMGPKLIADLNADFENVAENLQAALTTEPLQSKFKNEYSKLQYIDLRFGNKVYDKFSN